MVDRQQFAPPKALHVFEELADRYDSDEEFWTRSAEILATIHDAVDDGHTDWTSEDGNGDVFVFDFKVPSAGEDLARPTLAVLGGAHPDTNPRPYDLQLRPPPSNVGTRAALLVSGLMFVGSILLAVLTG